MADFSFWSKLESKQQIQIMVIVIALVLTGYGVYYAKLDKEISHAQSMVNRAKNRIKSKFGGGAVDTKENPQRLKKRLDSLTASLTEKKQRLSDLEKTLAPVDSMLVMQSMRLEITRLAESSGMYVKSMQGARSTGFSRGQAIAPDEKFVADQSRNEYERPLLNLQVLSDYAGLLAFLDGLSGLKYNVSPVKLTLSARIPEKIKKPEEFLQVDQKLDVFLRLAL